MGKIIVPSSEFLVRTQPGGSYSKEKKKKEKTSILLSCFSFKTMETRTGGTVLLGGETKELLTSKSFFN